MLFVRLELIVRRAEQETGDGRFSHSRSDRVETSSMDLTESERKRPEDFSSRSIDLSLLPYPLPRPVVPQPHRFVPDMIDLNRLRLHRVIQVKQETLKPLLLWPPSPPLLLRSPAPYFPSFHPSLVPFPFLHLSPNPFYPTKATRFRRRSQEASKPEKLNVYVDESYYVNVGGDQKRWKCRMCEKSYTSKYNLITHILGHSGIKPHECNLCGKLFKQLSHLHTHMLTHQGTRPHKCQVCHKAFTQTSHLKRHMMQHSDVKPYSCGVCGRGFAYPSELRAHELKHERGQENVCVECGLDFPTLAQLKRHLTAHRGPMQYDCGECGKSFQYPSQLQNHMMKHKDIRPFICSECGMEFVQSHHLKQHALTHKLCGKEFNRMHNLMGHMHLHSDSKPFKCLYCASKFTLKGNLTRHMKVKHGIMDQGLDARVFRRRGRLCLSGRLRILSRIGQEEPFDLSQKKQLRLSQSDGGSSGREEDEDSLYSPDLYRRDQTTRSAAEIKRTAADGQQDRDSQTRCE
ncbi:zinc finger protein 366-like isoform X1 [Sinocyclocheilus rhinocerous]|uniref:zinc finger protein 366-like isoform X1 n=2 Tax=Sinocyclocheilus rhinocerous TaxID=307959 RepID=UPI0007B9AF48|nr:PREDICTED: zinc finger protein 366-like isoform X1 [Sinocyclocheilus rhinocerous]